MTAEHFNNFNERFAATAERFGNRIAIQFVQRDRVDSVAFEELNKQADTAAKFLASRGIETGQTCVILGDNEISWCAAYLGILRIGAIAVPLDTHYSPQQIATLLKDCGSTIVFTTEKYAAEVEKALGLAGSAAELVLLRGKREGLASLEELQGESLLQLTTRVVRRDSAAAILYTSGTTSDPKGVILTHGNLLAEAESVFEIVKIGENDSILGVMPLYHSLAQMANLLLPFAVGTRVIFLQEISATELLRALREYKPTVFCCVPQLFYLIHQRVLSKVAEASWLRRKIFQLLLNGNAALRKLAGVNLGTYFFSAVHEVFGGKMRYLVTGGARFDPSVGRDFYKMGFNLLEAYGLTETSGAATATTLGKGGRGTVGKPLPGVEVKILPNGNLGGDGVADGEIAIRGPIVMQGYFNRPDATASTLKDGWFLTGDLGHIDDEGMIRITGRKKEVIVLSSGKNIYPEEIEAQYAKSAYIKELCVIGIAAPNEPSAERLHAVIVPDLEVLKARKVLNMKEVIRYDVENLSVELPAHKRILSYEIQMGPLPRTTTRKLKRHEIEKQRHSGERETARAAKIAKPVSKDAAAWAADPHVARALELLRELAHEKDAVHADANLELDLGLDSIERVEALIQMEQLFGTKIPQAVAESVYTVRQLVDAMRGQLKESTAERPSNAWNKLLCDLPKNETLLNDLLVPHRLFEFVSFALLKILNLKLRWLLNLRVSGLENLPKDGAFLICPNHETYLDPFVLASTLPYWTYKKLVHVGASEYFATPLRRWAARLIHLAPVDPDTNLVKAMQAGAFGLRHGKVLVLFPDGERSIDGEIKKFKKGAAILSTHVQVPIVPVAFEGMFPVWPRNRAFNWRAFLPWNGTRVRIKFGPPILPPALRQAESAQGVTEAHYTALTEEVRGAVAEMQRQLRATAD